ncbi:alpha/beta fold hydrolase [Paenibacillus caseinilyticus]|uniref:Alpha\beta hydrolase n=1 Tax=Paenibacillus mucilaginosus K02 TaxID=997761 RepID=I0BMS8_9BACL|nr:alpha/beta hydrolase [Paenibacillus mucilaginosus]AFH63675.1 alpha\beta hydrolase [Paenibacillus mucilaginosus K02]
MSSSGIIDMDGFPLAYRIEGEGPPVLIVGSETYYPRLFSQELRKKLQLIFVDHRAFVKPSRSIKPEDYTLERIVQDMEVIRTTLKLGRVTVLGHSGSAFIALEYARTYPGHTATAVLLNSAPTNSAERQQGSLRHFDETASPERKAKFERDIALLPGDIEREPERRFAHACIRMAAHSFYDPGVDAAPMWAGVYTNMEIIDHLWGRVFAEIDMLERLHEVKVPVWIGLGRYDYLVSPVSLWDGIEERCSHVKVTVFEHSGHNPMWEEPEVFDRMLTEWVDGKE